MNYELRIKKTNKQKGFTLVETLVAIFIFVLSTTALVVVTGNSVSDVSIAKNKLVARALSEEGIEMVRNIRDTSALLSTGPDGWTVFIDAMQPCFGNSGCRIENPQTFYSLLALPMVSACPSAGCQHLTRDGSNSTVGYFEYGPASDMTQFWRTIHLECVDGTSCIKPNEVRVMSTVEWNQGSTVKQVNAVENLFNWITI